MYIKPNGNDAHYKVFAYIVLLPKFNMRPPSLSCALSNSTLRTKAGGRRATKMSYFVESRGMLWRGLEKKADSFVFLVTVMVSSIISQQPLSSKSLSNKALSLRQRVVLTASKANGVFGFVIFCLLL